MEIAGIHFAPLKVPMDRRLQTLAAGVGFVWLIFGGFICLLLSIYLVLFTRYWLITAGYLLWVLYDKSISQKGGRRWTWVRSWRYIISPYHYINKQIVNLTIACMVLNSTNWLNLYNFSWWKYMKDYFPVTLERLPWVDLDPQKNYLFCCFPHGMLSLGVFCSFGKYIDNSKVHWTDQIMTYLII